VQLGVSEGVLSELSLELYSYNKVQSFVFQYYVSQVP
jgi:hypothetical protein